MMNEKRSGWIDGEENRADWTLTRAGLGLALPLHRASDLCRAKPRPRSFRIYECYFAQSIKFP